MAGRGAEGSRNRRMTRRKRMRRTPTRLTGETGLPSFSPCRPFLARQAAERRILVYVAPRAPAGPGTTGTSELPPRRSLRPRGHPRQRIRWPGRSMSSAPGLDAVLFAARAPSTTLQRRGESLALATMQQRHLSRAAVASAPGSASRTRRVAEGLLASSCQDLVALSLSDNCVGPGGVQALREALRSCAALQEVDLGRNRLGVAVRGIRGLWRRVARHPRRVGSPWAALAWPYAGYHSPLNNPVDSGTVARGCNEACYACHATTDPALVRGMALVACPRAPSTWRRPSRRPSSWSGWTCRRTTSGTRGCGRWRHPCGRGGSSSGAGGARVKGGLMRPEGFEYVGQPYRRCGLRRRCHPPPGGCAWTATASPAWAPRLWRTA